jgi:hypothetical protein
MSMRFDATLKDIARSHAPDYAEALRLTGPGPLKLLNVDLSTITAAADLILGHGDPPQSVVVLHFQASWDGNVMPRVVLYNGVAYFRYRVPVHNVVVLLRPSANNPSLDEGVHYAIWPERGRYDLAVEIIRMWEQPVEEILAGGPGVLPLAPLCKMPAGMSLQQALPGILRQIEERFVREVSPEQGKRLMTATFVLAGLRLARAEAEELFQGVRMLEESTTYQMIVDEGRLQEARKILLLVGRQKLGAADPSITLVLETVKDVERLERMAQRIWQAANWQDLLATL